MTEITGSLRFGLLHALRLWPLVIAMWLVPQILLLPGLMMLEAAVGPGVADLPPTGLPSGDLGLVLLEGLRTVAGPLVLSLAIALVLAWQWSVVWRAGVVSWQLWIGGGPVSLTRLLGLGLIWWWRYLRYSLSILATAAAAGFVFWFPLVKLMQSARTDMAEGRVLWLVLFGMVGSAVGWVLWWVSGLRGAWLLGRPDRRSAFLAFVGGMWGVLRKPVPNFAVFAIWFVPLVVFHVAPLLLALASPGIRTGGGGLLAVQLMAGAGAWCRLAVFLSYSPLSRESGDP